MDSAKFLRALADLIDAAQSNPTIDDSSHTKSDNTDVMVPPLQQEIELLKKSSNVASVYDTTENINTEETDSDSEPTEIGASAELDIIKKNAGLISEPTEVRN